MGAISLPGRVKIPRHHAPSHFFIKVVSVLSERNAPPGPERAWPAGILVPRETSQALG